MRRIPALLLVSLLLAAPAACGDDDKQQATVGVDRETEPAGDDRAGDGSGGDPTRLTFRPVLSSVPCEAQELGEAGSTTAPADGSQLQSADGSTCYRLGAPVGDGTAVEDAEAREMGGAWGVEVSVVDGTASQLGQLLEDCYRGASKCPPGEGGRGYLAVVLDGAVIAAPSIAEEGLAEGRMTISTGSMDQETAERLAAAVA